MEAEVFFEKLDISSELTCLNIREYLIDLIPRHSYIISFVWQKGNLQDLKIIS